MIKMGQLNTLDVLRVSDIAYVLTDEIEEIFLHKKQATRELEEGEKVDVFVYFDNLKRKTATMAIPKLDVKPIYFKLLSGTDDPKKRRSATASTFAASLELAKEGKIVIRQDEIFSSIQIKRAERDG